MSSLNIFVELLYRALDAPIGIAVRTSNPELARQKFYQARRDARNPQFEELSIVPSRTQPESELWILQKTPTINPSSEPSANGQTEV